MIHDQSESFVVVSQEAIDRLALVDKLTEAPTQIHMAYHGLVLVALATLAVSKVTTSQKWTLVAMCVLGTLGAVVTLLREFRNQSVREVLERGYGSDLESLRGATRFRFTRYSRICLSALLVAVYVLLFTFVYLATESP